MSRTSTKTTHLQVPDVVSTTPGNITDDSASSTEEKEVISADFADKLFHASHKRTWFHIIFEFLRHNQADRIELRSFCKLFRDLLPPPSQIWTRFPYSKHTTWESLINAVNAAWRKDVKKAPTLIVVRRRGVHNNNHDEMVEEDKEEEKEEDNEEDDEEGRCVLGAEDVDYVSSARSRLL